MAVIKVQIPLATNDPELRALALVYAEGRKHMVQQVLDPATQVAMGDDVKAFFEGHFRSSESRWTIGRRVTNQGW